MFHSLKHESRTWLKSTGSGGLNSAADKETSRSVKARTPVAALSARLNARLMAEAQPADFAFGRGVQPAP